MFHSVRHLFGTLAVLASATVSATDPLTLARQCERQWIIDSGGLGYVSAGADAMLARQWATREPQCGATSVYWGRLAILQARLRDFAAAEESMRRASSGDPQNDFVLDLAKAEVPIQRRLHSTAPLSRSDLQEIEANYSRVTKKYPNWPTAYALLGGTQTTLGKHIEAVASLRIAANGDAYQLSGVFRNLTVSLSALGEHKDALSAADRAGELDKSLLGDPTFAIAVANSHIALGYLDDARDTLQVIAARRPEVKTYPDFVRALELYERSRLRK